MKVCRENIAFLLAFHKQSQKNLAAHIGIDQSHVSHFLNSRPLSRPSIRVRSGKRASDEFWISSSKFERIAEFFGVELWELFRDDLPEKVVEKHGVPVLRAAKRSKK